MPESRSTLISESRLSLSRCWSSLDVRVRSERPIAVSGASHPDWLLAAGGWRLAAGGRDMPEMTGTPNAIRVDGCRRRMEATLSNPAGRVAGWSACDHQE